MLMTLTGLFLPVWAADPEIDRLLRSPVGKDLGDKRRQPDQSTLFDAKAD